MSNVALSCSHLFIGPNATGSYPQHADIIFVLTHKANFPVFGHWKSMFLLPHLTENQRSIYRAYGQGPVDWIIVLVVPASETVTKREMGCSGPICFGCPYATTCQFYKFKYFYLAAGITTALGNPVARIIKKCQFLQGRHPPVSIPTSTIALTISFRIKPG